MGAGERRHLVAALLIFAAAGYYVWNADFFGQELLAEIAIFAIFAMSLDLLVGYTGLVSLGHAAYYAAGAYATAALTQFAGWPVLAATAVAVLAAALLAALVGAFVVSLGGVFFIMITLAVGQMVFAYFFKAQAFGGDNGMSGTPRLDLAALGLDANDSAVFAWMMLATALLVFLLLRVVVRSPFGVMLLAIHQNENRVRALGCPVYRYKLAAFVIAGAVAGLAGSLVAQHTGFVSPDLAFWVISGEGLIMVIAGGMGTLIGPVIGAALFVFLRDKLNDGALWTGLGLPEEMADHWQLMMGLFFIAVVLLAADGVIGRLEWLWRVAARRVTGGAGAGGAAR